MPLTATKTETAVVDPTHAQQPDDTLDQQTDAQLVARIGEIVKAAGSTVTIAGGIGIAQSTLTRYVNGTWELSDTARRKIIEYLRQERIRTTHAALARGPVKLQAVAATRTIETLCRACMATNSMGFVMAPAGTGKTSGLRLYAQKNPSAIYIDTNRSTNAPARILEEIWFACGFRYSGAVPKSRARGAGNLRTKHRKPNRAPTIREQFEMIVDRFLVPEGSPSTAILLIDDAHILSDSTLETVRKLHDASKVAVVLAGTSRLRRLDAGGSDAQQFEQVVRRVGVRRVIRNVPDDDVLRIARAWMPDGTDLTAEAREYLLALSKLPGAVGPVVNHVRMAFLLGKWSPKPGAAEKLDVVHLRRAHKLLSAMCETCGLPVDECKCA